MTKTLVALIVTLSLAAGALAQDGALAVQLVSGREFGGAIDGSSTPQELVLRSSAGGLTIRRPIRWERIAAATLNAQPVAIAELKKLAAEARSREPGAESRSGAMRIEMRGTPPSLLDDAEAAAAVELPPPTVTTIAFDAFIANWDSDVETDGLVVELLPLDTYGNLIRASGVAEVELFASQRRTMQHAPLSGGDTLERVERWSQAINPADVGPNGVRLRLPFGQVHPELDPDWLAYNYGLVHVRFVAPGSGVFDESRDGIRIRPWAPNRDYLEMNTGRRFLPTENLGRRN